MCWVRRVASRARQCRREPAGRRRDPRDAGGRRSGGGARVEPDRPGAALPAQHRDGAGLGSCRARGRCGARHYRRSDGGRLVVGASASLIERLADLERRDRRRPARATSGHCSPRDSWRPPPSPPPCGIARDGRHPRDGDRWHRRRPSRGGHSFDISSDIDELAATPVAVVCSGAKVDARPVRHVRAAGDAPGAGDRHRRRTSCRPSMPPRHRLPVASGSTLLRKRRRPSTPTSACRAAAASSSSSRRPPTWPWTPPRWRPGPSRRWRRRCRAASSVRHVTPYVLAHVAEASQGRALRANIGLIVNNARTAGSFASALATTATGA